MTAAEGVYLLVLGSLAFALAIAVVLSFGIFLHAEKRLGHWTTPLFAPLIVFGIAAGSLLSGRNLTYASIDIESINAMGESGGGGSVLRLISFTLVGIGGARIFGWILDRKRFATTGGAALFMAFVAYFFATVVLNSAFGSYPAFIHNNYYFLAVASALYLARAERLDTIVKLVEDRRKQSRTIKSGSAVTATVNQKDYDYEYSTNAKNVSHWTVKEETYSDWRVEARTPRVPTQKVSSSGVYATVKGDVMTIEFSPDTASETLRVSVIGRLEWQLEGTRNGNPVVDGADASGNWWIEIGISPR